MDLLWVNFFANIFFPNYIKTVKLFPLRWEVMLIFLSYLKIVIGLYYFGYKENELFLSTFYGMVLYTLIGLINDYNGAIVIINMMTGGLICTATIGLSKLLIHSLQNYKYY